MDKIDIEISEVGPRDGLILALPVIYILAASAGLEYPPAPQTGVAREPEIVHDPETGRDTMVVSVLIYNVAGLPWPLACGKTSRKEDSEGQRIPIACNRSKALRAIGDTLGNLRAQGHAPDVIMVQEAFIDAAEEIPARAGYPNWVAGPTARETGRTHSGRAPESFLAERSFWKGEKLGKRQSSGLLVASNFPIVAHLNHPFNRWECGGFDCLANKGLMVVELKIPGLPSSLLLANTHYNARGASGVSNERALTAHNLQVAETNEWLTGLLGYDNLPFIWGGDLNMRHDEDRIRYFVRKAGDGLNEVSSYCMLADSDCEVRVAWDSDAPWFETQNLQGWVSGRQVNIEPVRVDAVFDEPVNGVMPSDHDGVLVFYRLSWPAGP